MPSPLTVDRTPVEVTLDVVTVAGAPRTLVGCGPLVLEEAPDDVAD